MTIVSRRTPDARFSGLTDYPFEPHYLAIDAGDGTGSTLRVHNLDERPAPADASGETVLLLHGEPTWSYLYRHVIPPLVAAGYRCVAPDMVGFGKSDKPTDRFDYTYQAHVDWLRETVFLYVHAEDDWGIGEGRTMLRDAIPGAQEVVIENAGHFIQEDIGPRFATVIDEFIRSNPAAEKAR
jgi:haloalkane dehalogenase